MYNTFPFAFPRTPISNFRLPSRSTSPDASRARHSSHNDVPRTQPKRHPDATSFGGSTAANDRTAVVFPVPFSPRRRTPPIDGSTAFTSNPFFRSSWPTNALKGNVFIDLVYPWVAGCGQGTYLPCRGYARK